MNGPARAEGRLDSPREALRITGIELGLNAGLTRVVIDASAPLEATLAAAPNGLGLVLALPAATWSAPPPRQLAAGLIGHAGLPMIAADHVTLSFDLIEPAVIERAFRLPPASNAAFPGGGAYRLVIDLRPADPATFAAAFNMPVALPLPSAADVLPPPPLHRQQRLVVLDPGHGGQDPGAISASGRYEKAVTLAVARAVAARLERSGRYRVLLTRENDRFIRLPQRVAFARQQEADLFLSIHADSLAADHGMRGAGIYTLAKSATDIEAETLALRENKADLLAEAAPEAELDDVVSILLDLASRDTPRLSSRFAGLLGASLGAHIPLRPKAVRAANFRVLTAPDIPSVLLELGYLSNPTDEALLFSDSGRTELANAIVAAIDRFFGVAALQAER